MAEADTGNYRYMISLSLQFRIESPYDSYDSFHIDYNIILYFDVLDERLVLKKIKCSHYRYLIEGT